MNNKLIHITSKDYTVDIIETKNWFSVYANWEAISKLIKKDKIFRFLETYKWKELENKLNEIRDNPNDLFEILWIEDYSENINSEWLNDWLILEDLEEYKNNIVQWLDKKIDFRKWYKFEDREEFKERILMNISKEFSTNDNFQKRIEQAYDLIHEHNFSIEDYFEKLYSNIEFRIEVAENSKTKKNLLKILKKNLKDSNELLNYFREYLNRFPYHETTLVWHKDRIEFHRELFILLFEDKEFKYIADYVIKSIINTNFPLRSWMKWWLLFIQWKEDNYDWDEWESYSSDSLLKLFFISIH